MFINVLIFRRVLLACMLLFVKDVAWAGDYQWEVNESGGVRLTGTIYESDIPSDQVKDLCVGSCSLYLKSEQCNGLSIISTHPIKGVVGIDTPEKYLEKVGWRVDSWVYGICPSSEPMVQLFLYPFRSSNGDERRVMLASNDGSGGTPLPPIKPEPEPLSCGLTLSSGGAIDWGILPLDELSVGKLAEAPNAARVTCSGGGTATVRLTFQSIDGGGDIAKMKNANGDIIPVKLFFSNESNSVYFPVQGGYDVARTLYARIQPYNITTYGEYKGSSLVALELF